MLNRISFYVFIQIFKACILIFFIFISISWLLQITRLFSLTNLLQVEIITIFLLSLFLLPNLITIILPFVVIFGIVLCFVKLNKDKELLAIYSSGLSYKVIKSPLIIFTLLLSLIYVILNFYISPLIYDKYKQKEFQIRNTINFEKLILSNFLEVNQDTVLDFKKTDTTFKEIFINFKTETDNLIFANSGNIFLKNNLYVFELTDGFKLNISEKEIEKNIKNIEKVFKIYLKTNNPKTKPIFVNNYKWLGKLNYIKFLREIGKHFTINKMLSFDSVKLRLDREQSLSYMEFNYMILQAYDFLELNKNKNCLMQIGGSDQWGNIVNGVELIKRHSNKQVFGLTTPLITLASGSKMGKTEKGAVWLDKKLLAPYDYWQFWRNTDDRDVLRFLQMFTDLTLKKIEELKNKNINQLKILLANKATTMLHGEPAAKKAAQTAKNTFEKKSIGDDLPTVKIEKEKLTNGINIIDLVIASNLSNSKSEVKRMIKNKGIKINNETVENDKLNVSLNNFNQENFLKLSHGKKNHVILKIV